MLRSLAHWFFPNTCIFCNEVIGPAGYCCERCAKQLPLAPEDCCLGCGTSPCQCGREECFYDRAVSPFVYDLGAKNAVSMLKFRGRKSYAKGLAKAMAERLSQTGDLTELTVVTAVPMYRKDEYDRGYNQAELIAKEIARLTGLPYRRLLVKLRSTPKQHNLTAGTRRENLRQAFASAEKDGFYQRKQVVLLCDDVLTTGATMNECAKTLKAAGAGKIICCTAAVATCRNAQDMVK